MEMKHLKKHIRNLATLLMQLGGVGCLLRYRVAGGAINVGRREVQGGAC